MPDFKDPYCYPNTNVLINKFGIRGEMELLLLVAQRRFYLTF